MNIIIEYTGIWIALVLLERLQVITEPKLTECAQWTFDHNCTALICIAFVYWSNQGVWLGKQTCLGRHPACGSMHMKWFSTLCSCTLNVVLCERSMRLAWESWSQVGSEMDKVEACMLSFNHLLIYKILRQFDHLHQVHHCWWTPTSIQLDNRWELAPGCATWSLGKDLHRGWTRHVCAAAWRWHLQLTETCNVRRGALDIEHSKVEKQWIGRDLSCGGIVEVE